MRLDEMWGAGGAGARIHRAHAPLVPSPPMLQTLIDMGFSRERAEQVNVKRAVQCLRYEIFSKILK